MMFSYSKNGTRRLTIQEEDGFGFTTKHWNVNQPKPKRENNIDGRWGSYFGTILCSCSVLFPNSKQNALEILKGEADSIRSLCHRRCYQHGFYSNSRRFQAVLLQHRKFYTKKRPMSILVTNIKLWLRIRIQQSKFRWIQTIG
jgi:hypothetical protein